MKTIFALLVFLNTFSIARNDIPSCYGALHMEVAHEAPKKALFILVDQTTILDKPIMMYVYKNMIKFIKNNFSVSIISFSANAKGKYTEVAYSGALEPLLEDSQKHSIAKKKLREYKSCMNAQHSYAKKTATQALVRVLKGANKKLPYSDILKSLSDISKNLITSSKAEEKIILLVSDMMEHSSVTSFYQKGGLRSLNTKKEISKLKKSGYGADFGGAKVFVIGAGMTGGKNYRDSKSLKSLVSFWEKYFQISHARLDAIGTPMLLDDIN